MKLIDSMYWVTTGIKTMLPAIIILILAWALAITTDELHTADFITNALKDSIHPFVIPGVIFILAASIAFSTGSSWSTMAILYPIAIPATYAICQSSGLDAEMSLEILLCVISTVLSASVLGDHISPISDTTILSSLASDCNHLDHVKTQIPYALIVGLFSLIFMTISIILGGGWIISGICMLLAVVGLYFVISIFGKILPEIPVD
jgi:Na+/H+ antiporter NhaC